MAGVGRVLDPPNTLHQSRRPPKPSHVWAQAVERHDGHVEGRLWETKEDGGYGLSSTVVCQESVEVEASSLSGSAPPTC